MNPALNQTIVTALSATGTDVQQAKILVVDDDPASLEVLGAMLKGQGYRPILVSSGRQALDVAETEKPKLILLDVVMPDLDGLEVCRRLKAHARLKNVPVICISALSDTASKLAAFESGAVDYITKPFSFAEVHARVTTHLRLRQYQRSLERHNRHLREMILAQVQELSASHIATIFALAKLAESRDNDIGRHLERVQTFCRLLAGDLRSRAGYRSQVDDGYVETIYQASPLHDIGKVGIPDHVLLKPGKLTPDEFEIMKAHTSIAAQTMKAVQARFPKNALINMGIDIALYHHERWDGTGYPSGLKGEAIPLAARIMAVADVYDALRSRRCYKPPFSHEASAEVIAQGRGTHFDPAVVLAFHALERDFREIRESLDD